MAVSPLSFVQHLGIVGRMEIEVIAEGAYSSLGSAQLVVLVGALLNLVLTICWEERLEGAPLLYK